MYPQISSKQRRRNFCKRWKRKWILINSRESIAWILIKGLTFLCCLTFFFGQTVEFLLVYYKYPTTTKIQFTYPDEFELPAVTICNQNFFRRSKFCSEYQIFCEHPPNVTEFCEQHPFICKDNHSNPLILKQELFHPQTTSPLVLDLLHVIEKIYSSGNITMEFGEEWTWNIITDTSWKRKPFFILAPGYFPCYAENLLLNSSGMPYRSHISNRYNLESIYKYYLSIDRSEEFDLKKEPTAYLSIHSPYHTVNPLFLGHRLRLGYKYRIFIRLEVEHLLSYPFDTDCINYTDIWIKNNLQGPRSQQMCKDLCVHDVLGTNKNMISEFDMLEYTLRWCGGNCKISSEEKKVFELCKKNCKANCRNLKYIITRFETEQDNCKKENRDSDLDRDKIEVEIFLGDRQVVVERHVPVYEAGNLFSYIGGLMGCWLGVSIWAFPGITENVFRRYFQWMEQIKR